LGSKKVDFPSVWKNMSAEILNNLKAVKIMLRTSVSKLHIHEV
jgi:hypothetical protein